MEHYVTLFDTLFLPQGLVLHMSMERQLKDYTLWILCVDDKAYELLKGLKLPNVRLLQLSKIETPELLKVKPTRTIGEYCWTLTPFAPRFVFEADPTVQRITYLDADLWFRKHTQLIFDEFESSGKQVLITDHAYAPEYDQTAESGQYCVQFMIFKRSGCEPVRKWWEERCIDWCYARLENNKFGDQKYLDDWPEQFASLVHVLLNKELALAPWNAARLPYGHAVFYHFHALRIISTTKVDRGNYFLPKQVLINIYNPYLLDLRQAVNRLQQNGVKIKPQAEKINLFRRKYRKLCLAKEILKLRMLDSTTSF
jgi:hypothetical protein